MGTGPIEKYEGPAATALRERAENAESQVEDLKSKLNEANEQITSLRQEVTTQQDTLDSQSRRIAELESANTESRSKIEKFEEEEVKHLKEMDALRAMAGDIDPNRDETPNEVTAQAQAELEVLSQPAPDVTL